MFPQNPFPGAFGLDIGDLSMKLIKLGNRQRPVFSPKFGLKNYYEVEEMRSINIPPGFIKNGELVQPEGVRRLLLVLLGKEGHKYSRISSPWVVCDLPEPKTFLKQIEIEIEPETLTDEDILSHARKHLPFELEEAHLDWELYANPNSQKITNVLIGAVHKVIGDSYTYLMESAGLQPIALEIEGLSIARAMVTRAKDYTGVARAILDLGATRSSLVVYDHDTIQFSTNFDFSGQSLTKDIADGLRIDLEQADLLLKTNGITYDNINANFLQIMVTKTDKLIEDIKKALVFYKEHFRDANPVTHITLCGGGANLKGLDVELSRKLKISARPGNAWKNLDNKKYCEDDKASGLGLASAIGLAIRAAESNL